MMALEGLEGEKGSGKVRQFYFNLHILKVLKEKFQKVSPSWNKKFSKFDKSDSEIDTLPFNFHERLSMSTSEKIAQSLILRTIEIC